MCWTWDCDACRSNNMRCALLCASDFDLDFSVRSRYGGNMNTKKITIRSTFNIYRSWCFFCPSVRKTSPNKGQQPCRHSQACKTQIVTMLETQRSQWTRCWGPVTVWKCQYFQDSRPIRLCIVASDIIADTGLVTLPLEQMFGNRVALNRW